MRKLTALLTGGLDAVHPTALDAPEEDFLFLLPAFSSFILVAAFPLSPAVWELTRVDDWPERQRRRLIGFYRSCLQRHLYATGQTDATVLSKNPSFSACVATLAELFPDARFVCCYRDPLEAIPSQLSSLRPSVEGLGYDVADPRIRDRFIRGSSS